MQSTLILVSDYFTNRKRSQIIFRRRWSLGGDRFLFCRPLLQRDSRVVPLLLVAIVLDHAAVDGERRERRAAGSGRSSRSQRARLASALPQKRQRHRRRRVRALANADQLFLESSRPRHLRVSERRRRQ